MKKVYVGMAAVIEKGDEILILKRSKEKDFEPETWETVTGRLEEEESPVDGILREIDEETGIKAEIIMPIDTGFFYRGGKEFPMVFISYYCKYLEGEIELTWEHTEYKWIRLDEALNLPDLKHFHFMLKNLKKLKECLPADFKFDFSPAMKN